MVLENPATFLSILILTTSCLILTSRGDETEASEDVLKYLWSLLHSHNDEPVPDFKEMLLNMSPEDKKKMKQLFDDAVAAQKESGRTDEAL
uniref:BLTX167 n=1 Tax=Nephila pilipes TaxID=299642 RepID=A0A076KUD2_NEPPI|nr:BLTX167 [Nephila pilipes]AII97812.1 BLTX440 [Nephila pilipes]AII97981.1 BLTX624 [Nephila pilipes]